MKEADIRPKELFDHYLFLSAQDAEQFDRSQFAEVPCPGCGVLSNDCWFQKNGFTYRLCSSCGTLYCSPRPSVRQLDTFYHDSPSAQFWADKFFPAIAEARRARLFRRKAHQIGQLFESAHRRSPKSICDVGAGWGLFLDELRVIFAQASMTAVEPNPSMADRCREIGLRTVQAQLGDPQLASQQFDLVVCQEVVEHVFSPTEFLADLFQITAPGGQCLVTTLGYEGFDILMLQEHSRSVFPPHHLNFLSISGFENVFTRTGFESVEVWTPGLLDFDIVAGSGVESEFVRVLQARGEDSVEDFQAFLQRNRLSSHVWILAERSG